MMIQADNDIESGPMPLVEFVPFPDPSIVGPPPRAGVFDDGPPPTAWLAPAVIVVMLLAVLAAGSIALLDRSDGSSVSSRSASPRVADPAPSSAAPTVAPTTVVPTTVVPTTVVPNTVAPTTVAPVTVAPVTTVAAPADGWIRYTAPDDSFRAELPGIPDVTVTKVRGESGVVNRSERVVTLPEGTLGIGTVPRQIGGRDVDEFLNSVAVAAGTQLGRAAVLGATGDIGDGRFLDFSVGSASGRLDGRAIYSAGLLHIVSASSSGDGAPMAAIFGRVLASFDPA